MSIFKDKVLFITGGTGSFGNAVLNRFLRGDIGEIRILLATRKAGRYALHPLGCLQPRSSLLLALL